MSVEGETINRESVWNVLDFGAVPDGESDNTAAFQRALDEASKAGGGVVHVPTGRFSFSGSLSVPNDVALRGVFAYSPAHAGIRDKREELEPRFGSVLMPRGGRGSEEGDAFIQLNSSSTLQGLCVYYPDQDPQAPEPAAYPWCVSMRRNNPAILDCELLNPYKAIDASFNQRHLIRNVHGQCLYQGILVDRIMDIGRIENVHWNPWWSFGPYKWTMANGTAFSFGRSDWQSVTNCFCWGYSVGYRFFEGEKGTANGSYLGIGADNCHTCVRVEESAMSTLLITNGEFVSIEGEDPCQIRVMPSHTGSVRFNNCAFWGATNRCAVVEGEGTVHFTNCTFCEWDHHGKDTYAIEAFGGTVAVRGCEFREPKRQVLLGKGVERAIVTENFIAGREQMNCTAAKKVILANNLAQE
jgi:hypothetical protein